MQVILDEPIDQPKITNVKYGGFWLRFAALIIDGIVLAPLTFGVMWFNVTDWKSIPVMAATTIISIIYKPYMEYAFGATLGKMAVRLKVVTLSYDKAEFGTIVLRNIFNIIPSLISLVVSFQMYNDAGFAAIESYTQYTAFSQQFTTLQFVTIASGLLTIAEAIMVGIDDRKRSLHDRIAGTYVIERP